MRHKIWNFSKAGNARTPLIESNNAKWPPLLIYDITSTLCRSHYQFRSELNKRCQTSSLLGKEKKKEKGKPTKVLWTSRVSPHRGNSPSPPPPAVGRKETLSLIIRNSRKVKGGITPHYWICSFLALFSCFIIKLFIFIVRSLKEIKTQTVLCTTICTLPSKHVLSD